VAAVAVEDIRDDPRRQRRLRHERHGGAAREEIGEVDLGIRGDKDDSPAAGCESLGKIEPALLTEVDVDEDRVRLERLGELQRLGARGGDAHNGETFLSEQLAGGGQEVLVVVNDQDT
jgi:hypothetical protein